MLWFKDEASDGTSKKKAICCMSLRNAALLSSILMFIISGFFTLFASLAQDHARETWDILQNDLRLEQAKHVDDSVKVTNHNEDILIKSEKDFEMFKGANEGLFKTVLIQEILSVLLLFGVFFRRQVLVLIWMFGSHMTLIFVVMWTVLEQISIQRQGLIKTEIFMLFEETNEILWKTVLLLDILSICLFFAVFFRKRMLIMAWMSLSHVTYIFVVLCTFFKYFSIQQLGLNKTEKYMSFKTLLQVMTGTGLVEFFLSGSILIGFIIKRDSLTLLWPGLYFLVVIFTFPCIIIQTVWVAKTDAAIQYYLQTAIECQLILAMLMFIATTMLCVGVITKKARLMYSWFWMSPIIFLILLAIGAKSRWDKVFRFYSVKIDRYFSVIVLLIIVLHYLLWAMFSQYYSDLKKNFGKPSSNPPKPKAVHTNGGLVHTVNPAKIPEGKKCLV